MIEIDDTKFSFITIRYWHKHGNKCKEITKKVSAIKQLNDIFYNLENEIFEVKIEDRWSKFEILTNSVQTCKKPITSKEYEKFVLGIY